MPLAVGSRLGPYSVTAKIGEGGMGQVYRARDTKLDRDVALKVLPQAFTEDPDRLARFEREAKVLASLNHPGIAAIYGLEEADSTKALVLELVEGPTLADRIARGPIPPDEALPIAKQIAEALEAAHEAGVIHRDLKPANIKVRDDGTVKVLDFGLAKALDVAPEGDPSQSPTLTAAATQMGVIMGTAAYMSPEQARGKPVDKRADVWAFGAVLFEMLTGERTFSGDDLTDTIAAVVRGDPNWNALPDDVPPRLTRVLRACLQKDRGQRVRDVGDVILAMGGAFETSSAGLTTSVQEHDRWRGVPLALGMLIVGCVVSGLVVWNLLEPTLIAQLPTRLPISPPPGHLTGYWPVLSRDGRTVALEGLGENERGESERRIYIRRLDQLEAVQLRDSEDTLPIGFSPNGEWLLVADLSFGPTVLERVPLAGGMRLVVAGSYELRGGAEWGPDDTVVFGSTEGLWRVPASGGERTALTTVAEGEAGHFEPRVLPNGSVLFYVWTGTRGEQQVAVYDVETGQRHTLLQGASPQFASSGYLVFARGDALWAVRFDPDRLEVHGDPRPVVQSVEADSFGAAGYMVAENGTLVYRPEHTVSLLENRLLVWVDRDGTEELISAQPRSYNGVRLSPDGRQVATQVTEGGNTDVMVYDLTRDTLTRLTVEPALDGFPVWTPGGDRVAFVSQRAGPWNSYWKAADGTGVVERLFASNYVHATSSFSPTGALVIVEINPETNMDIGVVSMEGEREVEWLLKDDFLEAYGEVSPDGKWLAYVSEESGRREVYVRPFPNVDDGKWQISREGADHPLWGPDSRELFYLHRFGRSIELVGVAIGTEPTFAAGAQRVLFEKPFNVPFMNQPRPYDISNDGMRFLMVKPDTLDTSADEGLVLVLNWFEELKRLVPSE